MGRFSCYGVYYGKHETTKEEVNKKVFNSWDEAKPYTKSSNARFKGFNSKESAEKWFSYIDEHEVKLSESDIQKSALAMIAESINMDIDSLSEVLNKKIVGILKTHSLVPINHEEES